MTVRCCIFKSGKTEVEAAQIGVGIIPLSIVEFIDKGEAKLLDNSDGISLLVGDIEIPHGDYAVLIKGKITHVTKDDFEKKYKQSEVL